MKINSEKRVDQRNPRSRHDKSRSGFTLVEILLVVVIIGLLLGVGVPRIMRQLGRSEEAAARMDMRALGTAIDIYRMDNRAYPPSLRALIEPPDAARNWDGPYMEDGLPTDPWGNDYVYQYPSTNRLHSYDLYSIGSEETGRISHWTSE